MLRKEPGVMTTAKVVAACLLLAITHQPLALAAVRGDDVKYVGGTIASLPQGVEGELNATDGNVLRFTSRKGTFEIPYESVTSIEYGQKAGRRIGVAIMVSPIALLSKKRKHYLSIGYRDANDVSQGVVLELPKKMPRLVITVLEARTGVKCDYESEEARKHVHG
jgi:hypothetical protein